MRLAKGYKGVQELGVALTPQHILRLVKQGKFPAPRKVGNVCWWRVEDIEAWFNALPQPAMPLSEG